MHFVIHFTLFLLKLLNNITRLFYLNPIISPYFCLYIIFKPRMNISYSVETGACILAKNLVNRPSAITVIADGSFSHFHKSTLVNECIWAWILKSLPTYLF